MSSKPNVLVIIADQHRYDCLGCYGNSDIKTPHIDALAQDGVKFNNAFSTFPVCTPARYSLITGLYVHQHLGWTNHSTIHSSLPTFPKILSEAGFHTACVGKMHYTPTYLDVGFDNMVLAEQNGPGRYDDDYHKYLKQQDQIDAIDLQDQLLTYRVKAPTDYWKNFGADESNLPDEHYSTSWIGRNACQKLESWGKDSNLLMVGFIKPHHPFDAPAPWSEMYNAEKLEILPGYTESCLDVDLQYRRGYFDNTKLNPAVLKKMQAQYYASITQIDHYVGQMVELLKKKGLYENTLIIYTSDHGDYLGYHHMGLKSNYMYDPVIRIPLVLKYPQNLMAGKHSEDLVSIADISSTILKHTGCNVPNLIMQTSIPLDVEDDRKYIFAETRGENYMVRSKKYKLLQYRRKKSLFFDLKSDPYELTNLYDVPNLQEEISKHKAALTHWLKEETPPLETNNTFQSLVEKFNKLYISPLFEHRSRRKIRKWMGKKMKQYYRLKPP